jgi:hypothetical protein
MLKFGLFSLVMFATVGCASSSRGGAAQRSVYQTGTPAGPMKLLSLSGSSLRPIDYLEA